MKKNLLLYILLAFLIVMNGFFLFKHFSDADTQDAPRKGPRIFIANQLKFNDEQTIAFEKLDAAHRIKMEAILEDIKDAKDDLFDKLSENKVAKPTIDSLATIIANHQAANDKQTFYFFQSIRELCNEDQKVRFESIIKDALHHQAGPPGRKGPPGRGGPPGGPPGGPDDGPERPPRGK